MINVLVADAQVDERLALQLMLKDMNMCVIGSAGDWETLLSQVVATTPDLILLDYGLLLSESICDMQQLRDICLDETMIILISNFGAREQAALSTGADLFISKNERFDNLSQRLRTAAESIHLRRLHTIN